MYQIIVFAMIVCVLTFAGDNNATDYAREQQHTDCLKRQQILTGAGAQKRFAYFVHGRVLHLGQL